MQILPRRPKKISAGCAMVFLRGFIKRLSADHGGITAGFSGLSGEYLTGVPCSSQIFLFRNVLVFKDFPSVFLN